jgi:hypothetical protein
MIKYCISVTGSDHYFEQDDDNTQRYGWAGFSAWQEIINTRYCIFQQVKSQKQRKNLAKVGLVFVLLRFVLFTFLYYVSAAAERTF